VTGLGQATTRLIVDPVLALVFPSSCPGCGRDVDQPTRGPLCAACWSALPRHRGPLCPCGFPLPPDAEGPCGRCRRGLAPFARGASVGPYEGTLRLLVHEMKFHARRRVAARLAEALLASTDVRAALAGADVLVPVPLHPRRRRERGFNQSALLARALAGPTGLRVAEDALARREDTPPQTGLSAAPTSRGRSSCGGGRPWRAGSWYWWMTCSRPARRPVPARALSPRRGRPRCGW